MNISEQIELELSKNNSPKYKQNQLRTIKYHIEGLKPNEISKMIGVSTRSIQRIIKEYTEKGMEEFLHKKTPGNVNPLTTGQIEKIIGDLKRSPLEFGFPTHEWSTASLMVHIQHNYNINISLEWCRNFLKKGTASKNHEIFPKSMDYDHFEENLKKKLESGSAVWYLGQFLIGLKPLEKTTIKSRKSRITIVFAMKIKLEKPSEDREILTKSKTVFRYTTKSQNIKKTWIQVLESALQFEQNNEVIFFSPKSQYAKFVASHYIYNGQKSISLEYFANSYQTKIYYQEVKEDLLQEMKRYIKTEVYKEENKRRYDKRILTSSEFKALMKVIVKSSAQ